MSASRRSAIAAFAGAPPVAKGAKALHPPPPPLTSGDPRGSGHFRQRVTLIKLPQTLERSRIERGLRDAEGARAQRPPATLPGSHHGALPRGARPTWESATASGWLSTSKWRPSPNPPQLPCAPPPPAVVRDVQPANEAALCPPPHPPLSVTSRLRPKPPSMRPCARALSGGGAGGGRADLWRRRTRRRRSTRRTKTALRA